MFEIRPDENFVRVLNDYGRDNGKVYTFRASGKNYSIGYAIDNSDWTKVKVRFAAYASRGKKKSNVYYFDVLLSTLCCNVAEVDTYVQKALNLNNDKTHEQNLVIDSTDKLQALIDNMKSGKVNPYNYIYAVCNILLCECAGHFSNNPYLDGHTAELNIGADWDYREEVRKIVTIVKDKDEHFKNVIDNRVFHINDYDERIAYLDTIREELINKLA